MSIELSAANFEQETQVAGPVIVDFWAPWCNPCRMLAPVLEELAKDKPEVKVCKVNIDEEQALAERFGVMSIPTVVCLRDGVEKSRSVGLMPKDRLIAPVGLNGSKKKNKHAASSNWKRRRFVCGEEERGLFSGRK